MSIEVHENGIGMDLGWIWDGFGTEEGGLGWIGMYWYEFGMDWVGFTSASTGDLLEDGGVVVLGNSTLSERRIAVADVAIAHHNAGAPVAARTVAVRVHTVETPQIRSPSNRLPIINNNSINNNINNSD